MSKHPIFLTAIFLLAAGTTINANAIPLSFSYTVTSGQVLSGMLDGIVQADNDTVLVSSVSDVLFDGVLGPALPFISKNFSDTGPAFTSFSGLFQAWCAATNPCSIDGFLFATGDDGIGQSNVYTSGISFGAALEPYNVDRWSLTPKPASIPEPASLGLGLLGLLVMPNRRRKFLQWV